MLPGLNFDPSFANLAALHGLGGMPHPIRPGGPVMWNPPTSDGAPMPGPMPVYPGAPPAYSGMPGQATMPMQGQSMSPYGDLSNLNALMQLFGRRNV